MSNEYEYIIIEGNPVDGFDFTGPFDTFDEATEYASQHFDIGWHIADLNVPEQKS